MRAIKETIDNLPTPLEIYSISCRAGDVVAGSFELFTLDAEQGGAYGNSCVDGSREIDGRLDGCLGNACCKSFFDPPARAVTATSSNCYR